MDMKGQMGGMAGSLVTAYPEPPSKAQEAATNWWTARDRYVRAQQAYNHAQVEMEAARAFEEKAWVEMEEVAERNITKVAQMPPPNRPDY